jgi:hypothetical protein
VPVTRRRRIRWLAVLVGAVFAEVVLAGCGDSPEHRYMLYNDTSGQRQVSLCTDDDCSTVSSIGWVDVGAYAEVTLPGDRVVLKVTSVRAGYVCAEGDDDLAGVLVALSAVAPSADEAAQHCIS